MTHNPQLLRAARQNLATDRMFGVDFVPRCATAAGQAPTVNSNPVIEPKPQRSETPGRNTDQKQAALRELHQRHNAQCPHCTTVTTHTQTVFGEGNPDAQLMFIGEAPGAEEDRTGRPFVGRAGQKLDEIIGAMGLQRSDVFIANVLKSRPPDNRTPLQGEVDACSPYLVEQIRIIEPAVIVTLGGPATKLMLQTAVGITKLRGIWAVFTDPNTGRKTPIMPTFHPAYLLRAYTPDNRRKVWSDMQAVMQKIQS